MLGDVAVLLVAVGGALGGLALARSLGLGESVTVAGLLRWRAGGDRRAARRANEPGADWRAGLAGLGFGLLGGQAVFGPQPVPLAGCAIGGLLAFPWVWRGVVVDRARGALRRQMPEVLATLAAALRAGRNLAQAVEEAAARAPAPADGLMRGVWERLDKGEDAEGAFRWLHERTGLDETAAMAAVAATMARTGGDMARAFDDIADQSRGRETARAEARAELAEQTALLYIFASYPAVLYMQLRNSDPGYFAPVAQTVLGQLDVLAMVAGLPLAGLALGVWWVKGAMR